MSEAKRHPAKGKQAVAELSDSDRQAALDRLRAKGLRFLHLSNDELAFWARHYGMVAER